MCCYDQGPCTLSSFRIFSPVSSSSPCPLPPSSSSLPSFPLSLSLCTYSLTCVRACIALATHVFQTLCVHAYHPRLPWSTSTELAYSSLLNMTGHFCTCGCETICVCMQASRNLVSSAVIDIDPANCAHRIEFTGWDRQGTWRSTATLVLELLRRGKAMKSRVLLCCCCCCCCGELPCSVASLFPFLIGAGLDWRQSLSQKATPLLQIKHRRREVVPLGQPYAVCLTWKSTRWLHKPSKLLTVTNGFSSAFCDIVGYSM